MERGTHALAKTEQGHFLVSPAPIAGTVLRSFHLENPNRRLPFLSHWDRKQKQKDEIRCPDFLILLTNGPKGTRAHPVDPFAR